MTLKVSNPRAVPFFPMTHKGISLIHCDCLWASMDVILLRPFSIRRLSVSVFEVIVTFRAFSFISCFEWECDFLMFMRAIFGY